MSEENKTLERRMYEEIYNKKNLDAVEQFYAADWVCHPWSPGMPSSLDGMKERMKQDFLALPDMQAKLDDMLSEGDKIACRWTATATHKGEFMRMSPTNKQLTMTGVHIDRIVDGKIVETWNYLDMIGIMQQLGMKPPG